MRESEKERERERERERVKEKKKEKEKDTTDQGERKSHLKYIFILTIFLLTNKNINRNLPDD